MIVATSTLAIPLIGGGREILFQFPQALSTEDLPYIELIEEYVRVLKSQAVAGIPITATTGSAQEEREQRDDY